MEVSYGSNKCLLVSCDENSEDEHYARKLTSFLYGQSRLDSVHPNPERSNTVINSSASRPNNTVKFHVHGQQKNTVITPQETIKVNISTSFKYGEGAEVIIDTGAPYSVCGLEWFRALFQSVPKAMRSQIEIQRSTHKFEFGGGEKRDSLGCVKIPAFVLDDDAQAHNLVLKVDIVKAEFPMLLGGKSLDTAEATMTMGSKPYLTLPSILGSGVRIPLRKVHGHYVFHLYPPTSEDDKLPAEAILVNKVWSTENAKAAISYIVQAKDPNYEAIIDDQVLLSKSFKRKNRLKPQKELEKNDVIKLHHYFGHCTADRLEKLIKNAGKWTSKIQGYLDEIRKCQICAVEAKRKPLPKTAIPRASNFNQLVTMDLKYNTKFKNKSSRPYILYIIDAFTRYRAATFIPDKKSNTIIEAFLINWMKIFGRPSTLHFDNGNEFVNSEMEALCCKYDIKITTTSFYSPNQNATNEKNHHYCDFMMTKILTADKDCSPEIALAWSVHAANVLESRFGVSPSMLVFGKNISAHPELSPHAPTTLETQINISEKIRSHLDAISKAKEAFIQAESDQTIADALKARIYHKYEELEIGQWIYWRNHESNKFQGPEKIVMLDNKKVFAIRNNKLISINRDHVILKRSEFENTQPLITLPPLPEENTHENSKVSD